MVSHDSPLDSVQTISTSTSQPTVAPVGDTLSEAGDFVGDSVGVIGDKTGVSVSTVVGGSLDGDADGCCDGAGLVGSTTGGDTGANGSDVGAIDGSSDEVGRVGASVSVGITGDSVSSVPVDGTIDGTSENEVGAGIGAELPLPFGDLTGTEIGTELPLFFGDFTGTVIGVGDDTGFFVAFDLGEGEFVEGVLVGGNVGAVVVVGPVIGVSTGASVSPGTTGVSVGAATGATGEGGSIEISKLYSSESWHISPFGGVASAVADAENDEALHVLILNDCTSDVPSPGSMGLISRSPSKSVVTPLKIKSSFVTVISTVPTLVMLTLYSRVSKHEIDSSSRTHDSIRNAPNSLVRLKGTDPDVSITLRWSIVPSRSIIVQSIFSGRLRPPRPLTSIVPRGITVLGSTRKLSSSLPMQSTVTSSKNMIGALSSQNASSPWLLAAALHVEPW
jgi:hypothetical protein